MSPSTGPVSSTPTLPRTLCQNWTQSVPTLPRGVPAVCGPRTLPRHQPRPPWTWTTTFGSPVGPGAFGESPTPRTTHKSGRPLPTPHSPTPPLERVVSPSSGQGSEVAPPASKVEQGGRYGKSPGDPGSSLPVGEYGERSADSGPWVSTTVGWVTSGFGPKVGRGAGRFRGDP